jgi:hypothetical protein
MTLLYSVRDSLGRELWWTTKRNAAMALAHDFNAAGEGARLYTRATGSVYAARAFVYSDTLENGAERGLAAHQLPVSVWKCNRSEVKS